MGRYSDDPNALRALVREDCVHRDVYLSQEVFDLEMRHLWRNTWLYVGHDSQVPEAGDFYTATWLASPSSCCASSDGHVRVMMNRCAHKGAALLSARAWEVSTAVFLRCPYHGWTYRLDGTVRTIPLKSRLRRHGFETSAAAAASCRCASS